MLRIAVVLMIVLTGGIPVSAKLITQPVVYEDNGVALEGYLAYDDAFSARRPGILIVHQWMGLSENEKMRAEMLAKMGYVAFAADVYGRGIRPTNVQEAQEQAGKYYGNRALFRERLAAGLARLERHSLVDTERVAAIGYCFGGGGVLELARYGADLAGVVSFHGSLDTPNPEDAKSIKAKILVCHGAIDPHVGPDAVRGFVEEMEAAGVDYQLILYAGAVHAFTQKGAGNDPSRGVAYNQAADQRSWQHMQDFFAEIFE
ncbi:MAG: dienelactone hydrolase family protein [Candidatus Eisenbacteria bacterium]|uniref:Dienelactone hydrolase family protein n=1 Tax=Eiseniibacteriota bacterium TaxID=2212470 RepID=A0A948WEC7_UNCEI|nr:dienelactone hydrolase family protein [Candidatus Eisenbacteria bacterium]MBU1949965.1 dienelactone hydrolase family protein [Candidatus Eisenbacteria bacterium]MBU2692648.1 dienelactone hydrolase family protein [Candidatus Eisenbacteria bacterium]